MDEKKPLHNIFSAVPPHYDLINHIVTLGLDTRWRRLATQACLAPRPGRVLDVCCGTGDLAIDLATSSPETEIHALDYSEPMLELARKKAGRLMLSERITFRHGDVAAVPYADDTFDCIGISFAFRNLTYRNPRTETYLAELRRVLRPGGTFVIIETSQPSSRFIRFFFRRYLRWFVFGVGAMISRERGAYRYFANSAENYYDPERVEALLKASGFSEVGVRRFMFGAVAIYTAT